MKNLGRTVSSIFLAEQQVLALPGIKSHKDLEIFQVILMSLAKSFTDLGLQQPSEKDKHYLANELADLVPRKFPSLRLQEIPIAFSRGIRGKYGAYYGLNVVSFEKFIETHLHSEFRMQLARNTLLCKKSRIPDLSSRFAVAKSNAIKAMELMKSGKEVCAAAIVYDFLDRLGLITFSIPEKWEFVDQAKFFLEASLGNQLFRMRLKNNRTEIQRKLNGVKDGSAIELIKNKSKELALIAFFNECILEKLNLEQLIIDRENLFV